MKPSKATRAKVALAVAPLTVTRLIVGLKKGDEKPLAVALAVLTVAVDCYYAVQYLRNGEEDADSGEI